MLIPERDIEGENALFSTNRLLLKNCNKEKVEIITPKLPEDTRIQSSVDLKMGFNDFNLQENHGADKRNYLKLPQLPITSYNCILNEERQVRPPDLHVE